MDLNSRVKRNNPIWDKNTRQKKFTIPAPGGGGTHNLVMITDENASGTYMMIANHGSATVQIINTAVGEADQGIPLGVGSVFETAFDFGPPDMTGGTVYAIAVFGLVGSVINVTYFS